MTTRLKMLTMMQTKKLRVGMKMTMQVMNLPKMQAMNPTANCPVTSPLE